MLLTNEKRPMKSGFFSRREEVVNAVTHGIGAGLAISGLVLLIVFAVAEGTVTHIVGFSIFGATMVILYLASTLYHSFSHPGRKQLFRKFDHMSIFLLIAGTYTPFCLTALPGWVGWTIFGIIWACAIAGIILKAFYTGRHENISTFLYIVMGWLIIPAIEILFDSVPITTFIFLMIGGVCYTAGTFFFMKDAKQYYHSIWHLFVLGGSTFHFFSVMSLL
jgi:hemolysin III